MVEGWMFFRYFQCLKGVAYSFLKPNFYQVRHVYNIFGYIHSGNYLFYYTTGKILCLTNHTENVNVHKIKNII